MDIEFRLAEPSEDERLARIMYNAFLPIWNHNWHQSLTSPLPSIPDLDLSSEVLLTSHQLTPAQTTRISLYRAFVALTRHHKGTVNVAHTPGDPSTIAAIVLLLPPHARATWFEPLVAHRTGMLGALLTLGFRGFYRVLVTFEGNVERMIKSAMAQRNLKELDCMFCTGCVRNPDWKGTKGPARKLFDWAIMEFWKREGREIPIWLDATTAEGVRAYEEIGFELVGECEVETGTDKMGFPLKAGASDKERKEAKERCRQRVMIRMPGEWKGDA